MARFKIGRPLAVAAIFMSSLLCAQAAFADLTLRASTSSSTRLPPGVMRVDGKGVTRVSAAGAATCAQATPPEAEAALAITNSIRAQRRLPPLATNQKLQRAAEAHACEMARRGVMSHQGASGTGPSARVKRAGYRPRLTAENIAAGRFDLNRVQQEWARSPGHLANILAKGAQHFGIGYAVAADGKTVFWAAIYANGR